MKTLSKLFTAIKGATNELGETIVDTQAIRIMEQEIREARKNMDFARENLIEVLADQKAVQREIKKLQEAISQHEEYAEKALDQNDEALAMEVAGKIAELTNQFETQSDMEQNYIKQTSNLKQTIATTENNIKAVDRELAIVKTTENVQKANEAIADKFSGSNSSLCSATDSLERIKAKQQKRKDCMQAAKEIHQQEQGSDLQVKLTQAGIVGSESSAESILAKLKSKRVAP
ncbi:MAG: PspA/IM30 family protein [Methylococcales bacterium]|nr:PspA/IM30 family protein [Methylococcales bacterium]